MDSRENAATERNRSGYRMAMDCETRDKLAVSVKWKISDAHLRDAGMGEGDKLSSWQFFLHLIIPFLETRTRRDCRVRRVKPARSGLARSISV